MPKRIDDRGAKFNRQRSTTSGTVVLEFAAGLERRAVYGK
jgi:hypothetical protein